MGGLRRRPGAKSRRPESRGGHPPGRVAAGAHPGLPRGSRDLVTATTAIPWWAPQIGAEERELLLCVIESNYLNEGDVTAEFERKAAELFGAAHGVATTS